MVMFESSVSSSSRGAPNPKGSSDAAIGWQSVAQ